MKKITCLLLALLLTLSLAACGSGTKSSVSYDMAAQEAPMAMAMESGTGLRSEAKAADSAALPEGRKWIITVNMNVETEDLDGFLATLEENLSQCNGYVENQSIHNGSSSNSRRYRSASLTLRIPEDQVDAFTNQVQGYANVVSNNLRREDVTLNYVATESKVNALKTEEARLLELMEQAETMADLLEIEARLSDVRYELEAYATQLRVLDNQIDYATIYLSADEVKQYTPTEEPTLWERIRDGFSGSLQSLGESLQDLLVLLIVSLPFLVVYVPILLLILFAVRKIRVVRKARKEKKLQEKQQKEENP